MQIKVAVLIKEGDFMSQLLINNSEYKNWIQSVSIRFQKSQIKAATSVNLEMLKFYWTMGHDISVMSKDASYGSKFYKSVSADLRSIFPNVHSFSVTNLKYMKYFYELFPDEKNCPQAGDRSGSETFGEINRPQLGDESGEDIIFRIPWGHIKLIIDKCYKVGDEAKALFYVKRTLQNNWSRAVLLNFLDTDLYEREGKAVSNFKVSLPAIQSDLAQQITKDPYNFDFLTIRQDYDEKELKDALMDNLQKFLLELGTGFAFVGREYRLVVGKTEQFLDMLFYNISLHCYVVVEVKVNAFDPGDMGQLSTYVAAVDGILKRDGDNQTIGLLVCKTKDKVLAQYSVNSVNTPIGISEYELSHAMPETIKHLMPTIEEIENELSYSE